VTTDTTTTRPLTEAVIRTITARHRAKVPWELQNPNGLTPYAVYLPCTFLYSPDDGRPVGDTTSAEARSHRCRFVELSNSRMPEPGELEAVRVTDTGEVTQ
jgi:hypothetical protein